MTSATGRRARVGLRTAREGARYFYTDMIADAPTPTAFTPSIATGASPRRSAPAMRRSASTCRLRTRRIVRVGERDSCSTLPRPWLAVGVGRALADEALAAGALRRPCAREAQRSTAGSAVFVGDGRRSARCRPMRGRYVPARRCDLTGKTTLPQLAAVLARADVMIANDTGPLHLAAALGRPVRRPVYLHRDAHCTARIGSATGGVETDRRVPAAATSSTCDHMVVHAGADAGPALAPAFRDAVRMAESQPFRLILASGSPAAGTCSSRHGYDFEVQPVRTSTSRPTPATATAAHYVRTIAWLKAAARRRTVSRRRRPRRRHGRLARRQADRQARRRGRRPPHPDALWPGGRTNCGRASACGGGPTTCSSAWQERQPRADEGADRPRDRRLPEDAASGRAVPGPTRFEMPATRT